MIQKSLGNDNFASMDWANVEDSYSDDEQFEEQSPQPIEVDIDSYIDEMVAKKVKLHTKLIKATKLREFDVKGHPEFDHKRKAKPPSCNPRFIKKREEEDDPPPSTAPMLMTDIPQNLNRQKQVATPATSKARRLNETERLNKIHQSDIGKRIKQDVIQKVLNRRDFIIGSMEADEPLSGPPITQRKEWIQAKKKLDSGKFQWPSQSFFVKLFKDGYPERKPFETEDIEDYIEENGKSKAMKIAIRQYFRDAILKTFPRYAFDVGSWMLQAQRNKKLIRANDPKKRDALRKQKAVAKPILPKTRRFAEANNIQSLKNRKVSKRAEQAQGPFSFLRRKIVEVFSDTLPMDIFWNRDIIKLAQHFRNNGYTMSYEARIAFKKYLILGSKQEVIKQLRETLTADSNSLDIITMYAYIMDDQNYQYNLINDPEWAELVDMFNKARPVSEIFSGISAKIESIFMSMLPDNLKMTITQAISTIKNKIVYWVKMGVQFIVDIWCALFDYLYRVFVRDNTGILPPSILDEGDANNISAQLITGNVVNQAQRAQSSSGLFMDIVEVVTKFISAKFDGFYDFVTPKFKTIYNHMTLTSNFGKTVASLIAFGGLITTAIMKFVDTWFPTENHIFNKQVDKMIIAMSELTTKYPSPDKIVECLEDSQTALYLYQEAGLLNYKLSIKDKDNRAAVFRTLYGEMKKLSAKASTRIASAKERIRPVYIALVGKAGIGKSEIMHNIMRAFFGTDYDVIKDVYNIEYTDYQDGYFGQRTMVADELFSMKNPEVNMKTINLINNVVSGQPYPMLVATPEKKGTVYAANDLFISASNALKFPGVNVMEDGDAYRRRRTILVEPLVGTIDQPLASNHGVYGNYLFAIKNIYDEHTIERYLDFKQFMDYINWISRNRHIIYPRATTYKYDPMAIDSNIASVIPEPSEFDKPWIELFRATTAHRAQVDTDNQRNATEMRELYEVGVKMLKERTKEAYAPPIKKTEEKQPKVFGRKRYREKVQGFAPEDIELEEEVQELVYTSLFEDLRDFDCLGDHTQANSWWEGLTAFSKANYYTCWKDGLWASPPYLIDEAEVQAEVNFYYFCKTQEKSASEVQKQTYLQIVSNYKWWVIGSFFVALGLLVAVKFFGSQEEYDAYQELQNGSGFSNINVKREEIPIKSIPALRAVKPEIIQGPLKDYKEQSIYIETLIKGERVIVLGFCINNRLAVFNWHTINTVAHILKHKIGKAYLKRGKVSVELDFSFIEKCCMIDNKDQIYVDLAFAGHSLTVGVKDVLSHFMDSSTVLRTGDRFYEAVRDKQHPETPFIREIKNVKKQEKHIMKDFDEIIHVEDVLRANGENAAGNCGSVLLMQKTSGYTILGIHISGDSTYNVSYTTIYQDDIRRVVDFMQGIEKAESSFDDEGIRELLFKKIQQGEDDKVVIKHDTVLAHYSTKSSIVHSQMIPPHLLATAPAHLRPFFSNGYIRDPLETALAKVANNLHGPHEHVLNKAVRMFKMMAPTSELLEMADLDTALNGTPEVSKIDLHTAAGVYKTVTQDVDGVEIAKFENYDKEEYAQWNETRDRILPTQKMHEFFEDYKREGPKDLLYVKDCLKDERLPHAKVEAGRARLFSVFPFPNVVCMRSFAVPAIEYFKKYRYDYGMMSGLNPLSREWHHLTEFVTANGRFFCADGDFSAFEYKSPRNITMAAAKLISELFVPEQRQLVRDTIQLWIVENVHIIGRYSYYRFSGNSSGQPLTTLMNCIVNWLVMYCAILNILEDHDFTYEQILKETKLITFGDDNLLSVSQNMSKIFTPADLTDYIAEFDMEYTDGNKSSAFEWKTIKECVFLKRGFLLAGYTYYGVLKKEVIFEMIGWMKADNLLETKERIIATCTSALNEAILYGIPTYCFFLAFIFAAGKRLGIDLMTETDIPEKYMGEGILHYTPVEPYFIQQAIKINIMNEVKTYIRMFDLPLSKHQKETMLTMLSSQEQSFQAAQSGDFKDIFPNKYLPPLQIERTQGGVTPFAEQQNNNNLNSLLMEEPSVDETLELMHVSDNVGLSEVYYDTEQRKDEATLASTSVPSVVHRNYEFYSSVWSTPSGVGTVLYSFSPLDQLTLFKALDDVLTSFKYFRCKIRITLRLNSTMMHYGKLMLSYLPETISGMFNYANLSLTARSSLPSIVIDANKPETVEMIIPFIHEGSFYEYEAGLGPAVILSVLAPLGNSQITGDVSVPYTFFIQLMDVELFAPIQKAQSSHPRYAVDPIPNYFTHRSIAPPSLARNSDSYVRLAMDGHSESSTSTTIVNSTMEKETEVQEIAKLPSLLTSFSWDTVSQSGTRIKFIPVHPRYAEQSNGKFRMPYLATVASNCLYWRGSIKYVFMFTCSSLVSARIKIDLNFENDSDPTNGDRYSRVIDINGTTTESFSVPYVYNFPYALTNLERLPNDLVYFTQLDVRVVNRVTVGSSNAASKIWCNVFVAADDDMEFFVPVGTASSISHDYEWVQSDLRSVFKEKFPPFTEVQKPLSIPDVSFGEKWHDIFDLVSRYSFTTSADLYKRSIFGMPRIYALHRTGTRFKYWPISDKYISSELINTDGTVRFEFAPKDIIKLIREEAVQVELPYINLTYFESYGGVDDRYAIKIYGNLTDSLNVVLRSYSSDSLFSFPVGGYAVSALPPP